LDIIIQEDKLAEIFSGSAVVKPEYVYIISGLKGTLTKILVDASTTSLTGFLRIHLISCSVSSNALFLQPSRLPSLNARSRAVVPLTPDQGESAVPDWEIAR
jgi:hypothetical protein